MYIKCYDYEKYDGELVDNVPNGKGIYKNRQKIYEGDFVNGFAHGYGEYKDEFNCSYIQYKGEFSEGYPHGKGLFIYRDGTTYEGNYKEGVANGKGVLTLASGKKIEAEFINGKAIYEDLLVCLDDYSVKICKGEIKDYKLCGKGTILNGNEQVIEEGTFANGQLRKGTKYIKDRFKYLSKNGNIIEFDPYTKFEGEFEGDYSCVDNKCVGTTVYGAKYSGEYREMDKTKIKGKLTYADGTVYESDDFDNAKDFGWCKITKDDGTELEGYFIDKDKTGKGPYVWTKNEELDGELINGNGILYFPNKCQYCGTIKEGLFIGEAVYFSHSSFYEGEFANGEFNGEGIYHVGFGAVGQYTGSFKNGKFHGMGEYDDYFEDCQYKGEFKYGNLVNGTKTADFFAKSSEGYFIQKDPYTDFELFKGKRTSGVFEKEGYFVDEKYRGNCILTLADGSTYEGEFADKSLAGKGPYIWIDADKFDDNLINGNVKLKFANGEIVECELSNGKIKEEPAKKVGFFKKILNLFKKKK